MRKIVCVKKLLLLFPLFVFAANVLLAQDEELPPPTSKPYGADSVRPDKKAGANDKNGFQGFKKSKKIDLSKYIIEPNFYFNISGPEIDLGIIPYVGYK